MSGSVICRTKGGGLEGMIGQSSVSPIELRLYSAMRRGCSLENCATASVGELTLWGGLDLPGEWDIFWLGRDVWDWDCTVLSGDTAVGEDGLGGDSPRPRGVVTFAMGDVALEEGARDSVSVSSRSSSPRLWYCTVVPEGEVMLMVTVSPPDCWESLVGLWGGVSVSKMFSRSPMDTLLVSGGQRNTKWYHKKQWIFSFQKAVSAPNSMSIYSKFDPKSHQRRWQLSSPLFLGIMGVDGPNASSGFLHLWIWAAMVLITTWTRNWIIPDAGLVLYWYWSHTDVTQRSHKG